MKNAKDGMLHIHGDYAIQGDDLSVTLYRRRITQKGKLQYDVIGYYVNMEQCFNRLIDIEIGKSSDLEFMLDKIESLKKDLHEAVRAVSRGEAGDPKVLTRAIKD